MAKSNIIRVGDVESTSWAESISIILASPSTTPIREPTGSVSTYTRRGPAKCSSRIS